MSLPRPGTQLAANKPQCFPLSTGSPHIHPQMGLQLYMQPCLAFYLSAEDLDANPQDCSKCSYPPSSFNLQALVFTYKHAALELNKDRLVLPVACEVHLGTCTLNHSLW